MRRVTGRGRWGRWLWGATGLAGAAAIAIPGVVFIAYGGNPWRDTTAPPDSTPITRTFTVNQPVRSVAVDSYGGAVEVRTAHVTSVTITETVGADSAAPLPGWHPVASAGQLTVADPNCDWGLNCIDLAVTVPQGVSVSIASGGGPVSVTGTAGAYVDSAGGQVTASRIGGPLTITSNGGSVLITGLTGTVNADTAGGDLAARDIAATTAVITTGGGAALAAFATPPVSVTVSTDGGSATVLVPGGPYAVTANSDGGAESVRVPDDSAARRSVEVSSGSGPLLIAPA